MTLDFAEIKRTVSIEAAAAALGIKLTGKGPQFRTACPACQIGGDRALAINTEKNSFYCFPSSKGGDCIGLAAHIKGIAQKDAAQFLVGSSSPPTVQKEARTGGMQPLDYLEPSHPAVEAIGFDLESAEAIGLGFAGTGTLKGYVALPVRLPDGSLAGYVGITEAKLPKQWHLASANVVKFPKTA